MLSCWVEQAVVPNNVQARRTRAFCLMCDQRQKATTIKLRQWHQGEDWNAFPGFITSGRRSRMCPGRIEGLGLLRFDRLPQCARRNQASRYFPVSVFRSRECANRSWHTSERERERGDGGGENARMCTTVCLSVCLSLSLSLSLCLCLSLSPSPFPPASIPLFSTIIVTQLVWPLSCVKRRRQSYTATCISAMCLSLAACHLA